MTTPEPSDTYADEVRAILAGFIYELCEECGQDIHRHTIGPDVLGHAHVYCLKETPDEP